MELLMILALTVPGAFTACFCYLARERRRRDVALALEKRLTETDPNHVRLKLAELGVVGEPLQALPAHEGTEEIGDNVASFRR